MSAIAQTRSRMKRVGHKGADLIVPGNTRASFDAALSAGVDMIEFDILPERGGDRLLLAHDYHDLVSRSPHTLEEALAHLAETPFDAIELNVWSVDERTRILELEALGVTGVVSNDPRLFVELGGA